MVDRSILADFVLNPIPPVFRGIREDTLEEMRRQIRMGSKSVPTRLPSF
jgi:hypothetical protein